MSQEMITRTLFSHTTDTRIGYNLAKSQSTSNSILFEEIHNSKEVIKACQDLQWTHDTEKM